MTMHDYDPKLNSIDVALIQLMKSHDGFATYQSAVDGKIPFELRELYKSNKSEYLPRLIAERANLYFEKRHEHGPDWPAISGLALLKKAWGLALAPAVVTFVLLAILSAMAIPELFFGNGPRKAGVLWVGFVILLEALLVSYSLYSTAELAARMYLGYGCTKAFERFIWIPRQLFQAVVWLRNWVSGATNETVAFNKALPRRDSLTSRQFLERTSSWLFAGSLFTLSLFAFLRSIIVFLLLFAVLFSSNVDYVLESSLISNQQAKTIFRITGRPVLWALGVPEPTEDAFAWASANAFSSHVARASGNEARSSEPQANNSVARTFEAADEYRRQWSYFLLASFCTYLILPRLLVLFAAWSLSQFSLRALLPKLSDDGDRQMAERICRREIESEAVVPPAEPVPLVVDCVVPVDAKDNRTSEGDMEPVRAVPGCGDRPMEEKVLVVGTSTSEQFSCQPQTEKVQRYLVVGLGLGMEPESPTARLSRLDPRLVDKGNLNGGVEQLRFRRAWRNDEHGNSALIVLASLTSVPTASEHEFLADVKAIADARVAESQRAASVHVILTDGKATRESENHAIDFFERRLDDWHRKVLAAGVPVENIHEFDISADMGAVAALKSILPAPAGTSRRGLLVAGKLGAAKAMIRKHLGAGFSKQRRFAKTDWTRALADVSGEIAMLYADERRGLMDVVKSLPIPEAVANVARNAEFTAGVLMGQVQDVGKLMSFFRQLSPGWMASGALAGAGLATILGISVAGTGGMAFLPALLASYPNLLIGGVGGAVSGQIAKWFSSNTQSANTQSAGSASEMGEEPRDGSCRESTEAIRAAILQTAVLELQGNPEREISRVLQLLSERLGHHDPASLEEIDAMLGDFESGMKMFGAKQDER